MRTDGGIIIDLCTIYSKGAVMSYKLYNMEDFASDPAFRNWVLNPDKESNYFWERWIIDNPDKKETAEKAIQLIKTYRFDELDVAPEDKQRVLDRIERTLEVKAAVNGKAKVYPIRPEKEPPQVHIRRTHPWRSFLKYAAIITGLTILGYSLIVQMDNGLEIEHLAADTRMIHKEISKGQKMKIFLPDGSIVMLNASSRLSYPEKFTGETRQVELSGEAFFEVAKDSTKPFIVKTEELNATALGTSFNVKSYADSDIVSVALVTGKAAVNRQGSQERVLLQPGEAAGFNKKTGIIEKEKFDYNVEVCWKDGILYFRETPISEVFRRIEQWYGVSVIVESIPPDISPINGSFNEEYLKNVLLSVGHAVGFDFSINGNEIYVKFKK